MDMACSGVEVVGKGGTLSLTGVGGGTLVGQPLRETNGEAAVRTGSALNSRQTCLCGRKT